MGDAVARVVWTGSREVAENLLESIMPDDPESFESEIVESEDGVSLTILISSMIIQRYCNTALDFSISVLLPYCVGLEEYLLPKTGMSKA